MRQAEDAGYDVLLTTDQGVPHQQNLAGRKIAVVVVRARTNQLEDLLIEVGATLDVLSGIRPGQINLTV